MIKNKDILEILIACSKAKFCTPEELLSEIGIEPLEVIDSLIRCGADLSINSDFSLVVDDGRHVVFTQPLFEFTKPIEEIQTLGDLAAELSGLTDEDGVIAFEGNEYDIIADAGSYKVDFDSFYTAHNSWEYTKIDVSKFLQTVKDSYGIQIERGAITKFYGTVEELCMSLTERINRAIEFNRK